MDGICKHRLQSQGGGRRLSRRRGAKSASRATQQGSTRPIRDHPPTLSVGFPSGSARSLRSSARLWRNASRPARCAATSFYPCFTCSASSQSRGPGNPQCPQPLELSMQNDVALCMHHFDLQATALHPPDIGCDAWSWYILCHGQSCVSTRACNCSTRC